MPRSKQSQSKHDTKVRQIAKEMEQKGFKVQADISGYKRPKTIGGYRPDVMAVKGSDIKIIEVETPDSLKSARDIGQQKAFRQAAKQSQNTAFRKIVSE
jgi:Holliday junction resolvase